MEFYVEFYVGLLIKLCVEILLKPFNVSFLSTYEFLNPYYLPDLKGKGEKKLSLKLRCEKKLHEGAEARDACIRYCH